MNYLKIYQDLVHKRQYEDILAKTGNGLVERHHILMRSLGGSNDPSNLVNLTLREHYFAHCLIVKIYRGTQFEDTALRAWNRMTCKMGNRTKTSRLYQYLRTLARPKINQNKGKICINNGVVNKYILPSEAIPTGFQRGMIMSEKRKKHLLDLIANNDGKIKANNGEYDIIVDPNNIPEGFVKGSCHSFNKGKIWVNNGTTEMMVLPDRIPEGFVVGALPFTDEQRAQAKERYANLSDEAKKERGRKISLKMKGRSNWAKGSKQSPEHIRKRVEKMIGRKASPETRRKISEAVKGKIKVNNGIITIYADPNNIPEGFVKGQLRKNKD